MPAIEFARGLESLECKRAEWSGAPRAPDVTNLCKFYMCVLYLISNRYELSTQNNKQYIPKEPLLCIITLSILHMRLAPLLLADCCLK